MAKFVDSIKRLIKKPKENLIINGELERCLKACDEMKDFDGKYDISNEEFCKAIGRIKEIKIYEEFSSDQLKLILPYMK